MEAVTIMTRKFLTNRLLNRKQMVVDVIHPGLASVSKKDLTEQISKKFKVKPEQIILFGFKTQFGGGKSSGFCLIYDSKEMLEKLEPKYRLRRVGFVGPKTTGSRKQRKEKKNRIKKVRGKEKIKVAQAAGGKKK